MRLPINGPIIDRVLDLHAKKSQNYTLYIDNYFIKKLLNNIKL